MPDPAVDIEKLSSQFPVALLPVRIETRFVPGIKPVLRIRVYPDEIFADIHEAKLSAEETAAGQSAWKESAALELVPEAWRRLLSGYSPARAAWIARETQPNLLPSGQLEFPSKPLRTAPLAEARSTVLPDCWVAVAIRANQETRSFGKPIPDTLRLSFRTDVAENAPGQFKRDELELEPELAWLVDFEQALAVGMAIEMPLTQDDAKFGFDRLLVLGAKTTIGPGVGGQRLGALLDAHHFTRGLAIVPQGTPTNNSSEGGSGYPPPDDADRAYLVERGAPLLSSDSDGGLLTQALGLDKELAHVEGADRKEQQAAEAMNRALWPCTLGYFLEQLMSPLLSAPQISQVRGHFEGWVRGRGPYPSFRIGRVPYGLLPATSIELMAQAVSGTSGAQSPTPPTRVPTSSAATATTTASATASTSLDELSVAVTPDVLLDPHTTPTPARATTGSALSKLVVLLAKWRKHFLTRIDSVPRVGKPGDPDENLLGALSIDASCREVRLREAHGPAYLMNIFQLLGIDISFDDAARLALITPVLEAAGISPTTPPRIAGFSWEHDSLRVGRPLVAAAPLSESLPLAENYIKGVRLAPIAVLKETGKAGSPDFKRPLLFHLLRQAALIEYNRIALDLAVPAGFAVDHERTEVELFRILTNTELRPTPWDRFDKKVTGAGAPAKLGDWLLAPSTDNPRAPVRGYRKALETLETLPTAELDRLFSETLDICSHRLDAWLTSMATRLLSGLRKSNPTGVHLGGFAWVENLRPLPPDKAVPSAGGYIHAPSASHAATAAILRSAHLTRSGAARERVRIDLSSARTRQALALLDGVRQGQPIGAVLGYHFERALHDHQLDRLIAPFRRLYPIGRHPKETLEESSERIAARDVVNGLTLREALFGLPPSAWGNKVPALVLSQAEKDKLVLCLAELDNEVDAASDLLTAESIYQAVQGNTDRAGASLATLAGSGTVPEPQVVKTPASGTSLTHRVAVVLGSPAPAPGWAVTPRRSAEPRLDAWVGAQLGDPAKVVCRISHAAPTPADPGARAERTVSLAELGLAPLDVLEATRRSGDEALSVLRDRLLWHASVKLQLAGPLDVLFARATGASLDQVTFPELVELARLLAAVIASSRPLEQRDLRTAAAGPAEPAIDEAELTARASAAFGKAGEFAATLSAAVTAATPDLAGLRSILWSATAYIASAVPGSDDGLLAQATAVHAELVKRLAGAVAGVPGRDRLAAIFGPELRVLPTFLPADKAPLLQALQEGPSMADFKHAPRRWLERNARTRAPLARLRLATLASEAITRQASDLSLLQLPHATGRRWIGLPFDRNLPAQRPLAGSLSLALRKGPGFVADAPWAGLLVDEWSELVPHATQTTSFAVHHDAPAAEAPQCVLLAVQPTSKTTWDLDTLITIVKEQLDLAQIRAVEPDQLGWMALLAPCIYVAENVAGDTISIDLSFLRQQEAQLT